MEISYYSEGARASRHNLCHTRYDVDVGIADAVDASCVRDDCCSDLVHCLCWRPKPPQGLRDPRWGTSVPQTPVSTLPPNPGYATARR